MQEFEAYLTHKGLKRSTIESILERVTRVQKNCDPLTEQTFQNYIDHLRETGITNTWCNRLLTSLLHYKAYKGGFEWLTDALYLPEKNKQSIRAVMSPAEINAIINCPRSVNQRPERHEMWSLFFETLAVTGCRPSEVANLGNRRKTLNYIDFGAMALVLEDTKTDSRTVPLSERIVERFRGITGDTEYYFPRVKYTTPIRDMEWNAEFHSRCRRCGIERKGLSVYSFRHSYITEMVGETDVFSLMTLVGHRKATTTQRYYHSNLKKLREESKKHPLLRSEMTLAEVITMIDDLIHSINSITSVKADYCVTSVPNGKKYVLKITQ